MSRNPTNPSEAGPYYQLDWLERLAAKNLYVHQGSDHNLLLAAVRERDPGCHYPIPAATELVRSLVCGLRPQDFVAREQVGNELLDIYAVCVGQRRCLCKLSVFQFDGMPKLVLAYLYPAPAPGGAGVAPPRW